MEDHFFSINKLVNFGLSMAIAQQMVQTMNQAIEQQKTAGATQSFLLGKQNTLSEKIFYIAFDNKESGPYSEIEMTQLIKENKVTKSSLIWIPGMKKWDVAENIPEVLRLVALQPPKLPNI